MNLSISSSPRNIRKTNINSNISFKALPTKVCGFCKPEDVGVVLDAAMY